MGIRLIYECAKNAPARGSVLSGRQSKSYGSVRVWLQVDAGDAAAGDLVGREGLAVFVGEVEETVSFGGLFQPVDESLHLDLDDFLCASEADSDDYECHVGDSEMAFGAFPQAELNGTVLAKVVDAGSDGVPVESGIIGVAAEYFYDICAEVEEEVHDGIAGCGFDFLHVWCGC